MVLALVDGGRIRTFDKVDTTKTILPVVVSLTRVCYFTVVGRIQRPAPVALHITINYITHCYYLMTINTKKYLFTYRHDGAEWGIEIPADSPEDARSRMAKMAYATYEGEVHAVLPANLGLVARLLVALRNLFSVQPAA